jgi:hypothetical protein
VFSPPEIVIPVKAGIQKIFELINLNAHLGRHDEKNTPQPILNQRRRK